MWVVVCIVSIALVNWLLVAVAPWPTVFGDLYLAKIVHSVTTTPATSSESAGNHSLTARPEYAVAVDQHHVIQADIASDMFNSRAFNDLPVQNVCSLTICPSMRKVVGLN